MSTPQTATANGASASGRERGSAASWNETRAPHSRDAGVHRLFERQALQTPDALALAAGKTRLTYREIDTRANRLAQRLRGLGVGRETLVGVLVERSPELFVGMLAALKAGAAFLPLDPDYPDERLAFVLRDANASVLLTRGGRRAPSPDGSWNGAVLEVDAPEIAHESTDPPFADTAPEDLAYVIYTSGSTGRPKGVEITHGSLSNLVSWHQRQFGVTPADRATQVAGVGFDAAIWELWPYLCAGSSVHFPSEPERKTPTILRDWLVAREITMTFLPTAMAEAIMALAWPRECALRALLTGADVLRRRPSRSLPFPVINNYGPTEATVVATSGVVAPDESSEIPPSIGRPIANTRIHILDGELRPVAIGDAGELYIAGAGLARGYRNRPDLTAERFLPDPFSDSADARLYRTGDLARRLPDGEIAFLGRVDDQIKTRGYRVEPNEVVAALCRHPMIRASAVVGLEETPGDRQLVAYVVPAGCSRPSAGEIREFLLRSLPEYMIPTRFVGLETLPMGPHGKVDRSALPPPNDANLLRQNPFVAPRTSVEERVAEILSGLLGLPRVGVQDNFFLLGGHSLLGAQLIARVRDAFGVELPLRSLFESPTVEALSAEIERAIHSRLEALNEDEVRRMLDLAARPDETPDHA